MAKKQPSAIKREEQAWGTRLTLRPFTDAQFVTMEITGEVAKPKPGRSPEIRVWFTGVPMSSPLRTADVLIWIEAMRAMEEEARKVAEEMKQKK